MPKYIYILPIILLSVYAIIIINALAQKPAKVPLTEQERLTVLETEVRITNKMTADKLSDVSQQIKEVHASVKSVINLLITVLISIVGTLVTLFITLLVMWNKIHEAILQNTREIGNLKGEVARSSKDMESLEIKFETQLMEQLSPINTALIEINRRLEKLEEPRIIQAR